MKLIIAGSRTFTDYPRLCQVLAPDKERITQAPDPGAVLEALLRDREGLALTAVDGRAEAAPRVAPDGASVALA